MFQIQTGPFWNGSGFSGLGFVLGGSLWDPEFKLAGPLAQVLFRMTQLTDPFIQVVRNHL